MCKYCEPIMTIRTTTFFEHIPESSRHCNSSGRLSIRAMGTEFFLHYENSDDVFFTPVEIDEHWPIRHCPMCGEKLPSLTEVGV